MGVPVWFRLLDMANGDVIKARELEETITEIEWMRWDAWAESQRKDKK